MRNRFIFLITLHLLLPLIMTKAVFADQTQTISIYSPDYNYEVFAYTFSPSYLHKASVQTYQSEHIEHIRRQNIIFPTTASGEDIFMFQDINNNKAYTPTDPSLFIPNLPTFDYKQMTLVTTVTKNLSFEIQKIDNNNFIISITSTDNAINFDKYEKQYLQEELVNSLSTYSAQTTSSGCNRYFCGTVSAQFKDVESGNYDIEINYGPETLAYIKNAISIIRPTLAPITQNTTLLNLPKIPTQKSQQNHNPSTIMPTKNPTILLSAKHESLNSKQIKEQKLSLIQVIFKYLENIFYEIRNKL